MVKDRSSDKEEFTSEARAADNTDGRLRLDKRRKTEKGRKEEERRSRLQQMRETKD